MSTNPKCRRTTAEGVKPGHVRTKYEEKHTEKSAIASPSMAQVRFGLDEETVTTVIFTTDPCDHVGKVKDTGR